VTPTWSTIRTPSGGSDTGYRAYANGWRSLGRDRSTAAHSVPPREVTERRQRPPRSATRTRAWHSSRRRRSRSCRSLHRRIHSAASGPEGTAAAPGERTNRLAARCSTSSGATISMRRPGLSSRRRPGTSLHGWSCSPWSTRTRTSGQVSGAAKGRVPRSPPIVLSPLRANQRTSQARERPAEPSRSSTYSGAPSGLLGEPVLPHRPRRSLTWSRVSSEGSRALRRTAPQSGPRVDSGAWPRIAWALWPCEQGAHPRPLGQPVGFPEVADRRPSNPRPAPTAFRPPSPTSFSNRLARRSGTFVRSSRTSRFCGRLTRRGGRRAARRGGGRARGCGARVGRGRARRRGSWP